MNRPKFHDDQLAYVITLEAMLQTASAALRVLSEHEEEDGAGIVRGTAKAALKQMREIGGFDL